MAKKHGHEEKHAHCEHCLHVCDHCDIAYCCDCNKEWGKCNLSHYPYWYVGTTSIPCTTPDPYWHTTSAGARDVTDSGLTINSTDAASSNLIFTDGSRGVGPDCVHAHN